MKITHITIPVMLLGLLMTGCTNSSTGGDTTPTGSTGTTDTTTSTNTGTSSQTPAWEGKTNEDFEYAKLTYTKNGVEKDLNRNTLYLNQNAPHLDPLAAEPHVMIVPFGFTDSNLQSRQTQETIDRMQTTFFGTREELDAVGAWESLATYYQKSSYGKSNFSGQVLPSWCVYNGTSDEFYNKYRSGLGISAASYAANWYREEYAKENHGLLGADAHPYEWFDSDGDGFLDLVWIVYSHATGSTSDWWAYVTYTGNVANKTTPAVKTLGFASIDWMNNGFNGYDPHTFIHETGHTYSLDDYYDYNNTWTPMCGVDMMDHNLGDHCMYSKFSLGWTAPLVVNDTAQITLRPGSTTGDCFIIPSPGYNGTCFDEYMMVELMAPVGIAEQDYKNGYSGTTGFDKAGIRITHVDSRAYKANADRISGNGSAAPQDCVDLRLDNTYGGRGIENDYFPVAGGGKRYMSQIGVMVSNGKTWDKGLSIDSGALFKKGARFNLNAGTSWAETMPSGTNLWNKAKVNNKNFTDYTIDETCTFDYNLRVISIEEDAEYGYKAVVQVNREK